MDYEKKYKEFQVYETENGEVITYSKSEGYKVVEPKLAIGTETSDALEENKQREELKKIQDEKDHLSHLKNYHFNSAKELIDYVYAGNVLYSEDSFEGVQDKIKLMDSGTVGHWSLWLSEDDCCVLGTFWRTQSKEDFEKWVNSCFACENFLDHGYMPAWHMEYKHTL